MRERVVVSFGLTSDWSRKLREFFKPITKRSNVKPKRMRITFDTRSENRSNVTVSVVLLTDSSSPEAVTTPVNTVPVITSEQLNNQDIHKMQQSNEKSTPIKTPLWVQVNATFSSEHVSSQRSENENKAVLDTSGHQAATKLPYRGNPHTSPSDLPASTRLSQGNDTRVLDSSTESPVMWVNVTDKSGLIPKPTTTSTGKNSSLSGPQDDASGSDDNITAGIIPALIILSVLAVPIVFLLLISITLRLRAYHRDKRSQMNGFHGSRKDLSVGRSRGWWSYMNCCDRQKYKFNRVTLQDFYSDSDSDGV